MKGKDIRVVENPKFPFKKPKVKFKGDYFKKRMREIRKSLPKGLM